MAKATRTNHGTVANTGYKTELYRMADTLCGNLDRGTTKKDISIYGQDSNYTTWRLMRMNLAIRGIDGQTALGNSFHNDHCPNLKVDYILVSLRDTLPLKLISGKLKVYNCT